MTSPPNTLTYHEVLSKLESAKREFKQFEEGQRKALYQSLQRVAEAAVLVVADEKIEARYCKSTGNDEALRAALMFIFDPHSLAEKQEASKRSRALWYLIVKRKVAAEDIARAIPKHGGVEKLARLAAKSRDDQDSNDKEDHGEPEEGSKENETEHKFGKPIRVVLSPKLTKKLNRFGDKTRIKIIGCVRLSLRGLRTVEAEKIVGVAVTKKDDKPKAQTGKNLGAKPKAKPDDDDGEDWD
jgi:hypothetical protein